MLKADFHIHSKFSGDSITTLEQIIRACERKKITCMALSDHGTIEGALRLKELAPPFYVVVSEEILTTRGEIMGMFLSETVPSGFSLEESIKRIKDQGGLFCAQHPFDRIRPDSLKADVMDEIARQIDVVEVFNARNLLDSSRMALAFAQSHHLPGIAGSDAHAAYEIGNAYVEMPEFKGKEDFLQAVMQGTVHGHRTNPLTRFASIWARIRKW